MDKEFLFDLLKTCSVSGFETEIEKKIYDRMKPVADAVTVDELGNVTAVINPDAPFKVLLPGHADEIGLFVSAVTDSGFLKVFRSGGICAKNYPGHKVAVHTASGVLYGAVVSSDDVLGKEKLSAKDLLIDIGAKDKEDALKHVALGDPVCFDTDVRELLNGLITGRAMDDRVGVYIVMEALRRAKEKGCAVGVYAVSTTGEETNGLGAFFTGNRVKPNACIAVDVTFATDYAGADDETGDIRVGKGPVICNANCVHKKLNTYLYDAAKRLNMEVQTEAAGGHTGTDGDTVTRTGIGVPFALVSIPLRYMHNPAEVGSLADIEQCADLVAEFLCGLTNDTDLRPF